jgi:hypothetical protein
VLKEGIISRNSGIFGCQLTVFMLAEELATRWKKRKCNNMPPLMHYASEPAGYSFRSCWGLSASRSEAVCRASIMRFDFSLLQVIRIPLGGPAPQPSLRSCIATRSRSSVTMGYPTVLSVLVTARLSVSMQDYIVPVKIHTAPA